MTQIALSSGCFIGYERCLASCRLKAVELSGHRPGALATVLETLRQNHVRIVSVHCPCPNRGVGLNLSATGEDWIATKERIHDAMKIAASLHASFIVIHAYYCGDETLPADDILRAEALRRIFGQSTNSIAEYLLSQTYLEAKEQAKQNLKTILPELRRTYPEQKIVLENLNPRTGYGGIRIRDLLDIAEEFNGDVGICLDVGHLTLSAAALGIEMNEEVAGAKDLIWTTHIHQNFAGRYYLDRNWNESIERPGLQELDTHLPLLSSYRLLQDVESVHVSAENSAFSHILRAPVQYTAEPGANSIRGDVPVEDLLNLVNSSALRVLEFDSRYAPLDKILTEYELADQGTHPIHL